MAKSEVSYRVNASGVSGVGGKCQNLFCPITHYTVSAAAAAAKSLQSCPTLCDPIDGSPPGSPIPGILQTRILEWVVISFSNTLSLIFKNSIIEE